MLLLEYWHHITTVWVIFLYQYILKWFIATSMVWRERKKKKSWFIKLERHLFHKLPTEWLEDQDLILFIYSPYLMIYSHGFNCKIDTLELKGYCVQLILH